MSIEEEISEYKSGNMNARYVDSLLVDLIDHYEATKDAHAKHTETLAKLAAMESRKPDMYRKEVHEGWPEWSENDLFSDGESGGEPWYRGSPVPADRPAVSVPDGWKEIVEAVAHIGVDFGYGAFVLSQEHINKARELLEAAPSRSQQSARPADDELWDQTITERDTYHDWADKLANAISEYFGSDIGEHTSANNPWAEALEVIERDDSLDDWRNMLERAASFMRTSGIVADQGSIHPACSWLYEAELLLADRCPSHESEQGG